MDESPELRLLFHRLNNQLGIILAHAELLEAKAPDEKSRARAAQVVASAIDALVHRPGHSPSDQRIGKLNVSRASAVGIDRTSSSF